MKICGKCKIEKSFEDFYKHKARKDGYANRCKQCAKQEEQLSKKKNPEVSRRSSKKFVQNNPEWHKNKSAQQRARKLNATPSWASLEKIEEIYYNCPKGFHVDHIVPLKGKKVCGLHVENNLQYLDAVENIKKSNKYEVSV